MNHGCQVSAAEKRATWLLSMDGVLLASAIFLRNFVEATKCGGASGSAKARFSMFA